MSDVQAAPMTLWSDELYRNENVLRGHACACHGNIPQSGFVMLCCSLCQPIITNTSAVCVPFRFPSS